MNSNSLQITSLSSPGSSGSYGMNHVVIVLSLDTHAIWACRSKAMDQAVFLDRPRLQSRKSLVQIATKTKSVTFRRHAKVRRVNRSKHTIGRLP